MPGPLPEAQLTSDLVSFPYREPVCFADGQTSTAQQLRSSTRPGLPNLKEGNGTVFLRSGGDRGIRRAEKKNRRDARGMGQSASLTPPYIYPTSRTGESQCTDEANTSQQGDSVSRIIIPPQIPIHVQAETIRHFQQCPSSQRTPSDTDSVAPGTGGKGTRSVERQSRSLCRQKHARLQSYTLPIDSYLFHQRPHSLRQTESVRQLSSCFRPEL
jgi:hypothetical protein